MKALLAACALALCAASASAALAGTVDVKLYNVDGNAGVVRVALCLEAQYPRGCVLKGSAPAKAGTTIVTVHDVPPGSYGVLAYQDVNDNSNLDRTPLGAPTEPWGVSNDPPMGRGLPTFDQVSVHVKGDRSMIAISLKR